jgi:hypothetical protein
MVSSKIKNAFGDISNWKWFVLVAILLRGPLWLFFGHLVHTNLPAGERIYNYFVKDDYVYFFQPVDNYFQSGVYSYSRNVPFTGRMPGYSIIYFLFRFILSKQLAAYCVVTAQFLLSSISVYVLALTSFKIFESKRAFYITFCLYVLAIYPGFFDFIIVAESFSVSALIFTLFFLVKYLKEGYHTKHLLLSGTFLVWTIFLREYTGLLIVLFPLAIGIHHLFIKKNGFAKALIAGTLFCLPFIMADTAWIIRNYNATGKFIPITASDEESYGKLYSPSWNAIDDLAFVWGENAAPFDASGVGYYFRTPANKSTYKFPERIFKNVTTYNNDSLVHLRQLYATYYYTKDTTLEKNTQKRILDLCAIYRQDYISHNQFSYWVIKPIKDIKYLIFFSGTGYLPLPSFSGCNIFEKGIKVIFSALYFLVLICASLGIILYIVRNKTKGFMPWLMLISSVSIITIFITYCPIQEPRYFVHVFMMMVLFASFFINEVMQSKAKS